MMKRLMQRGAAILALCGAVMFAPSAAAQAPSVTGGAPVPDADAQARAKRIAERFEANARVLTIFDRQGRAIRTVGERAVYGGFVLSPDATRVAIIKNDLEKETHDLWVLDLETAAATRITSTTNGSEQRTLSPVWSPDGSRIAYVALRDGYWGLYEAAANGQGGEQLVYRHPGANLELSDWSLDGRYLVFSSSDLSSGVIYALPLTGASARTPVELFRTGGRVGAARVSPDGRLLSYALDEARSGPALRYVRAFTPTAPAPETGPGQIVPGPAGGALVWRTDGRQVYYQSNEALFALDVDTSGPIAFGEPALLFRLPVGGTAGLGGLGVNGVSRTAERIVIAVHPSPVLEQITVFDRTGKVVRTVGEPGRYRNPAISPDGATLAVVSDNSVWAIDLASGTRTRVSKEGSPANDPVWSPDGRYLVYTSTRGVFTGIYRKAADGTGDEEQIFQYTPGASMVLTDWSSDGRFLTFHDGCAGVLHLVPTAAPAAGARQAIDWLRDEYSVAQARFSPDSRFIAYLSDELKPETMEVYVRPFDPAKSDVSTDGTTPVRISTNGARGMIVWRQDGRELYYLTPDHEVMAVDVATAPTFRAGAPRLLFKVPGPYPLVGWPPQWKSVSRDGERFVFVVNVPAGSTAASATR